MEGDKTLKTLESYFTHPKDHHLEVEKGQLKEAEGATVWQGREVEQVAGAVGEWLTHNFEALAAAGERGAALVGELKKEFATQPDLVGELEELEESLAFVPLPGAALRHDEKSQDLLIQCSDGKEVKAHSQLLPKGFSKTGADAKTLERYLDIIYGTRDAMNLTGGEFKALKALAEEVGNQEMLKALNVPKEKHMFLTDLGELSRVGVLLGTAGDLQVWGTDIRFFSSLLGLERIPPGWSRQDTEALQNLNQALIFGKLRLRGAQIPALASLIPDLPADKQALVRKALGVRVLPNPMPEAIREGDLATLQGLLLLTYGKQVLPKAENHQWVVLAAQEGRLAPFRLLLEADPNRDFSEGSRWHRCLYEAQRAGNYAMIAAMHEVLGEKLETLYPKWEERALVAEAVAKGHLKDLSRIPRNFHDPKTGDSLVHMAVKKGDPDLLRFLLEAGHTGSWCNWAGESPYAVALREQKWEIAEILEQANVGPAIAELPHLPSWTNTCASDLLREDPTQTTTLSSNDGKKIAIHAQMLPEGFQEFNNIPLEHFSAETIEFYLDLLYGTSGDFVASPKQLLDVWKLADFLGDDDMLALLEEPVAGLYERSDDRVNVPLSLSQPGALCGRLLGTGDRTLNCSDGEINAHTALVGEEFNPENLSKTQVELLLRGLYTGAFTENLTPLQFAQLWEQAAFLPEASQTTLEGAILENWDRQTDQHGFSPLALAMTNHPELVPRLIDVETDLNHAHPETGMTPLHIAASQNRADWVSALIDAGADATMGHPAILSAANLGNVKAFRALLLLAPPSKLVAQACYLAATDAGAPQILSSLRKAFDTKIFVPLGPIMAQRAMANKHDLQTLDTELHTAARTGNEEDLNQLLEEGYSLEWRNRDGLTPLHAAAQAGHQRTVLLLLEAGANPDGAADLANTEALATYIQQWERAHPQ